MRLLPRGRPAFAGLAGPWLSPDHLFGRIRDVRFSGFLELSEGPVRATFAFQDGETLSGTFEGDGATQSGAEALARARQLLARDGSQANLYEAEPAVVALLHTHEPGPLLYAELDGALIAPEKLARLLRGRRLSALLRVYEVRTRRRLGTQLLRAGKITEAQLADAMRVQLTKASGRSLLGGILVELGHITQEDVNRCLAEQMDESSGADLELGVSLFLEGEIVSVRADLDGLLSRPGSVVDIYQLSPKRAA